MRKITLLTAKVVKEDGLYCGRINEVKGIFSVGKTLSKLRAELLIAYRLHMDILEGDLQFKLIEKEKELIKVHEFFLLKTETFLSIHGWNESPANIALKKKLRDEILEIEELIKMEADGTGNIK